MTDLFAHFLFFTLNRARARLQFFGNMGMVAFHHVPEYLNRWLMPPSPRLINLVVL